MNVAMFGCWGDTFVRSSDAIAMDVVLDLIKADSPHHLIIAGDNYYAEKRKNEADKVTKIIHVDTIKQILGKLPDVPIDIITGNHEMDETDPDKIVYESFDPIKPFVPTTNCEIVKLEMMAIDELNQTRANPIHIRIDKRGGFSGVNDSIRPPVSIIGRDCYIFVDSSMYEYTPAQMSCYKKVFGDDLDTNTYPYVQSDMIRHYLSTIERDPSMRIFFVAHHPLLVFRYKPASSGKKSKKESAPTNINHHLISFLFKVIMENGLNQYKLHYLCADFHLYQHQTVILDGRIEIDVHIVGTGGADQDEFFDIRKESHTIELLQESEPNATFIVDRELSLDTTDHMTAQKDMNGTILTDPNIPVKATCLSNDKSFGYLQITDKLLFKPVGMSAAEGGRKTKRRRKRKLRTLVFKKRRQSRNV
jgi:hypothetical protein